ncbi:MAG: energy transducer TonB [Gemmatimonadaceae bacterium]|nr:energy transducer TonB [Gemmatimonadaceae bacterium]NUQ92301.1 energy transducer TonB [Gemmatimonadaceae bacterium]NUR19724.1 energy transducer TonB [Gemmatimonadaceae bacterium]NUS96256.1 energy transducer TonB [Gemmatimonadaceae bacterium]
MFATLLETKAKRERRGWGTAVSVAAHGAIVLLLVVATRMDARPTPPRRPGDGPVIWTQTPVDPARGGRTRSGGGPTRTDDGGFSIPHPHLPGTSVDIATPGPSFSLPGESDILSDIAGGGGAAGGGAGDGGSGIASDLTVDERVGILTERRPRYPEALRAARVTGLVTVRFVVDTSGRADMRSLVVVESPNDQLTDAVRAALRGTRFTPGRVRGRAVPTLVQRSFRFELEGAR